MICFLLEEGGSVSTYKVLSRVDLTPETFILRTEKPLGNVRAGQCFSLGTNSLGINREYSIYSSENESYLEFLIRKIEGGAVSSALSKLERYDEVEIWGPYGEFCIDWNYPSSKNYTFIATGTGIAPFHSFILTYPDLQYKLLHGIRFDFEKYQFEDYDARCYQSFVSRPNQGKGQYVTDGLKSIEIKEDDLFYLCGNREMISDAVGILRSRDVSGNRIYMETFF